MAMSPDDYIVAQYQKLVSQHHPARVRAWPIISGYHVKIGSIGDHIALILLHSGSQSYKNSDGIGALDPAITGVTTISSDNVHSVKEKLAQHFRIKPEDGIVIYHQKPDGQGGASIKILAGELEDLLLRHETALGLAPMKIFLSHKSADKPFVRDFFDTLKMLGFDPWLDEDAMVAGASRERSLLKGFEDSCAVVFFVTENFVDENYLATEIEYAINEKRKKGDRFAIIALRFTRTGGTGTVPALLDSRFIYKEPTTDLEALREIIRALPISVGAPRWRP